MSMVSRISMAFLESTDNSSSPSGQGISTIVDSNVGVLVIEKKLNELHILDGFVFEGWKRRANPPLFRIFWKTSWGVSSLNGGTPVRNSKRHTPSAHQSTMKSARVDDDNNNNKRRRNSHIFVQPWASNASLFPVISVRVHTNCTAVAKAGTTLDTEYWGRKHSFILTYKNLKTNH